MFERHPLPKQLRTTFLTEFTRIQIDFREYQRLVEPEVFFASLHGNIEDAVTGQRGDWDWYGSVQKFFADVNYLWSRMKDREREGAIRLNHDSPEEFLAEVTPELVGSMGLIDLLNFLRKATCAQPEIEDYNWSCPGDQPKKPDPERDQRFIAAFQSGLVMAAFHRLQELCQLSAADIEEVLRLKPVFDSLTVDQFQYWNGWEPMDLPEGGKALHVPYPEYHPVVRQWIIAVQCSPFCIDAYVTTGESKERFWLLGAPGRPTPREFFSEVDLDEVRRFMVLSQRGERFCNGNMASDFERGVIQAAFHGLEELFRQSRSVSNS